MLALVALQVDVQVQLPEVVETLMLGNVVVVLVLADVVLRCRFRS